MVSILEKRVVAKLPRPNPVICEGIAYHSSNQILHILDQIFRSLAPDFVQGMTYDGIRVLTPEEEAKVLTTGDKGNTYDVSRSDYIMIEIKFSIAGEPMSSKILVPFIRRGNIHTIQSARYIVNNVVDDQVLSPGRDSIYVGLIKAKLVFKRLVHYYTEDGHLAKGRVVYSEVHNAISKKSSIKAMTTMVHYLLCRYGFKQMFEKYNQPVPEIIVGNEEQYPISKWIIFSSAGKQRRGMSPSHVSPIRLAVRRDEVTVLTRAFIAGFYYIVDHFPDRVEPMWLDDIPMWRRLLGVLLYDRDISEGKMEEDVNNHMRFLNEYLDDVSNIRLARMGIKCHDIFDLFVIILENFNSWIRKQADTETSMYTKTIQSIQSLLLPLVRRFNTFHFKMKNRERTRGVLGFMDVAPELVRTLTLRILFTNKSSSGASKVLSSTGVPGDNMMWKATTQIANMGAESGKKNASSTDDSTRLLDGSILEVGQIMAITEADPDGRGRLNAYAQIHPETGNIVRNEKLRDLIDEVQRNIK